MAEKFLFKRRVEFRDTDMAGIVHFSVFHTYMEEAEHEFLRHLGLGVISEIDGRKISFPRVKAACDYRRAIKFEQIIEIHVTLKRIGDKSLTFSHEFYHDGMLVASGEIATVCCYIRHGEPPESCPIPDTYRAKLEPYLVTSEEN